VLLSGLPRPSNSCPSGRKASPRKMRGFCIVRLFDEQRVSFYGFSAIGLTPPKIEKKHTMPAGILQHLPLRLAGRSQVLFKFFFEISIVNDPY